MAASVPKPVVTAEVCSVCGLPWEGHGEKPTIEKCVELLKKALEDSYKRPTVWWNPGPQTYSTSPFIQQ